MSIKENREKQVSLYIFFFSSATLVCVCRSLTSFQTLDNKGGGLENKKRKVFVCVLL